MQVSYYIFNDLLLCYEYLVYFIKANQRYNFSLVFIHMLYNKRRSIFIADECVGCVLPSFNFINVNTNYGLPNKWTNNFFNLTSEFYTRWDHCYTFYGWQPWMQHLQCTISWLLSTALSEVADPIKALLQSYQHITVIVSRKRLHPYSTLAVFTFSCPRHSHAHAMYSHCYLTPETVTLMRLQQPCLEAIILIEVKILDVYL